ncbi:peptide deformylase [Bosea sp. 124]|uniref:peptide deformylase n=1 Tax=Bosea sp. 124 TaxID=2135642 RepID=UPI000D3CD38C|nr:peptide deformylase [Bosea sp. 124]PTM39088.1 peptide deformylase [Bosea sp. 124]
MTVLPIVRFPDPRLRAVAEPVEHFDADLRRLANNLLETMRAAPGVGITAPHVGVMLRLVVLELSPGEVRSYVNPTLLWLSPETSRATEGSVSMPGVTEEVERAARVRLSYRDLDGAEHAEEADGFLAVCHQHEIDQLDGIFWLQRLSRLKRERVISRYGKLQRS